MDSFFNNGTTTIVFQHRNKQSDDRDRRKYHLIAYAENSDGSFRRIKQNLLFVDRTSSRVEETPGQVDTDFANLYLKKSDFTDDPAYPYILLWPHILDPDDSTGKEYIYYKMYFAEHPNDNETDNKSVKPIDAKLNPSPPRNNR